MSKILTKRGGLSLFRNMSSSQLMVIFKINNSKILKLEKVKENKKETKKFDLFSSVSLILVFLGVE